MPDLSHYVSTLQRAYESAVINGTPVAIPVDAAGRILRRLNRKASEAAARRVAKRQAKQTPPLQPSPTMPKRKTKPLPLPDPTDPAVRWFLDYDNDGHHYLVPASKRAEWEQWIDLPYDDPMGGIPPEWATPIDGPHRFTFTLPIIT